MMYLYNIVVRVSGFQHVRRAVIVSWEPRQHVQTVFKLIYSNLFILTIVIIIIFVREPSIWFQNQNEPRIRKGW